MPKYITDVDRWLSHECRMVKAGEEFETEFPEGMRLSDTIRLVKQTRKKAEPVEQEQVGDVQA